MPAAWCRFRVCLLHAARHGSYVASCVWRLCRVPHWLSRTMLRACCWLPAARCSPHTICGGAVCFPLQLASARVLLHVVCCLMHVVCCMRCLVLPSSARGVLHAACCLVTCRLVSCCRLCFPNSTLSAACRMLPCCLLPLLSVVNGPFQIPRCLLHAARCPLHVACCVACRCCPLHVA